MKLPSDQECYQALLNRDEAYLGRFIVGVVTTGVFCLPTCRARKPKFKNCQWYPDQTAAGDAGFRACKVCQPLRDPAAPPQLVVDILDLMYSFPGGRVTDAVLREKGHSPFRVRRTFSSHYGITFQAFQRRWRLERASDRLAAGERVTQVAYDSGYESLSGFLAARKAYRS